MDNGDRAEYAESKQEKRVVVFAFHDADGIADKYIDFYLADLIKNVDRLIFVATMNKGNETLNDFPNETKELFLKYSDEIIVLDKAGSSSVFAYQAGLAHIGWDKLAEYDELVLADNSVFGPIFPLKIVFNKMGGSGFDFWGITLNESFDLPAEPQKLAFSRIDYSVMTDPVHVPDFIPDYFIVFGNTVLRSTDFRNFWSSLSEDYADLSVTQYFAEKDFSFGVYAEIPKEDRIDRDVIRLRPDIALREYKVPFIRNDLFAMDYLEFTTGEGIPEALRYIRNNTDYDVDLILASIIRRYHQYDIFRSLALTYIIPDDVGIKQNQLDVLKTALVMHLYYPEMLDEALYYASMMPEWADIFVSTNTDEKAQLIRNKFSVLPNDIQVRIIENRGRSESALLIGMVDVFEKYDLICFWKEKVTKIEPKSAVDSWSRKISENLLGSRIFTENIIVTFSNDPRLGMLSPTPPNHSVLYRVMGEEWTTNYESTKALAVRLGLRVPMSPQKPPLSPLGGAFWCRTKALKKLIGFGWKYGDFPQEPLKNDRTLLHSIERIYPFAVQDAGYYPAYILNSEFARLEYSNLYHYLRSSNTVLHKYLTLDQSFKDIYEDIDKLYNFSKNMENIVKELNLPREQYEEICLAVYDMFKNQGRLKAHIQKRIDVALGKSKYEEQYQYKQFGIGSDEE